MHYRFWYLSFVACVWNSTTCVWESPDHTATLNYELTLVNGDPNAADHNPFEYQFSFDKQVRAMVELKPAWSFNIQLSGAVVNSSFILSSFLLVNIWKCLLSSAFSPFCKINAFTGERSIKAAVEPELIFGCRCLPVSNFY